MNLERLDALVVEKIMNWKPLSDGLYWDGQRSRLIKGTCIDLKRQELGLKDSEGFAFSPSTDIAAAWEVVEKLAQNESLVFDIEPHHHDVCREGIWLIRWMLLNSDDCKWRYTWSDSFPLAVCLTALKTVGVEIEA